MESNRRREERRPQNRAAVLITEDSVAFPANVVDASEHGIGLVLSIEPSTSIGSKATLRFRKRDLEGTIVRSQAMAGQWSIGLRLDKDIGLEFFKV